MKSEPAVERTKCTASAKPHPKDDDLTRKAFVTVGLTWTSSPVPKRIKFKTNQGSSSLEPLTSKQATKSLKNAHIRSSSPELLNDRRSSTKSTKNAYLPNSSPAPLTVKSKTMQSSRRSGKSDSKDEFDLLGRTSRFRGTSRRRLQTHR